MAHDVFISYSSKDKQVADAICNKLESERIRCWIAPRDILPGKDWGEAIIDAIESSKVMLLVFSSHANQSVQIKREVERAVNKGVPVVPLRIEDIKPTKSLEYFISTQHWLDAISPPLEKHLDYLVGTVRILLDRDTTNLVLKVPQVDVPLPIGLNNFWKHPFLKTTKFKQIAAAGAFILLLLFFFGSSEVESALVGEWQTVDTAAGIKVVQVNSSGGKFENVATLEETGKIEIRSGKLIYMVPNKGYEHLISWTPKDNETVETSNVIPNSFWGYVSFTAYNTGSMNFADINKSALNAVFRRRSGDSNYIVGSTEQVWEFFPKFNEQQWELTLTTEPNGNYTFRATFKDTGTIKAKDGKWSTVSNSNIVRNGDYQIVNDDTISVIGVTGPVLWKRLS